MRYTNAALNEYRFRKMREFSARPFQFNISAPGMETDGGIGNASFDGLDDDYDSAISPTVGTLSQKTKDFIGENLIDIENTLKALNLDFLQTFNEMDKNDSAETLFGDNYTYDSNASPKTLNTPKLSKLPTNNYSSIEVSPKSTKSSQYSPLDKHLSQPAYDGDRMQYFNDSGSTDKIIDGKRSSTPDTGFASRETNTSSRRGSQKSSYSPQDTHFSPSYTSQLDEARAVYAQLKSNGSFPSRQRSMSFTENYSMKSPVLSEPQSGKMYQSCAVGRTNSSDGQPVRRRQRNTISHKPRSIRARNLRRLSYNPIILDSSSSSSDDNEYTRRSIENIRNSEARRSYGHRYSRHSIASPCKSTQDYDLRHWHNSESDIRLKNRHTTQFQSNTSIAPNQQLYGSNASIKSAPQYNNFASDAAANHYTDRKHSGASGSVAGHDMPAVFRGAYSPAGGCPNVFFARDVAKTGGRISSEGSGPPPPPTPPTPQPTSSTSAARQLIHSAFNAYAQFDVSKLTGKSPTTQSFLQDVDTATPIGYDQAQYRIQSLAPASQSAPPQSKPAKKLPQTPLKATSVLKQVVNKFQWPEKIHVSAIAAQSSNSLWSTASAQPKQSVHPVNAYK